MAGTQPDGKCWHHSEHTAEAAAEGKRKGGRGQVGRAKLREQQAENPTIRALVQRPLKTQQDLNQYLIDISRLVLSGALDTKPANTVAILLRGLKLPEGEEASIEQEAAELPHDAKELAEMERELAQVS